MANIESHQPLHGKSASLAQGNLREATPVGKLVIRCDIEDAAVSEFLQQHELVLPVEANTCATSAKGELFWLGPDEWLLRSSLDPGSTQWGDIVSALQGEASPGSDRHLAIVDVSDYYTVLQLDGPHAGAMLARSCPLDLHTLTSSAVKRCAQTRMGNAAVMLDVRLQSPQSSTNTGDHRDAGWNLQVRWSYADYLWKLLQRSAISF